MVSLFLIVYVRLQYCYAGWQQSKSELWTYSVLQFSSKRNIMAVFSWIKKNDLLSPKVCRNFLDVQA